MNRFITKKFPSLFKSESAANILRKYSPITRISNPKSIYIKKSRNLLIKSKNDKEQNEDIIKNRSKSVPIKLKIKKEHVFIDRFNENDKKTQQEKFYENEYSINDLHNTSVYAASGEIKYFKYAIRGKEVPLNVEIKNFNGKAIIYYSQVTPHPNSQANDKIFTKKKFKIYGSGVRQRYFTAKMAYFGIKILEGTNYVFSVTFGVEYNFLKNRLTEDFKIEEDSLDNKLQKTKKTLNTYRSESGLKAKKLKRISSNHLPLMFSKANLLIK